MERGLDRLGYEYYNPRVEDKWKNRGQVVTRLVQLFPGYLFVKIIEQWQVLLTLADVIGIIKDQNGPLKVPSELVEQIRSDERGGRYRALDPQARFISGQSVRLSNQAGVYADKLAVFDGMRGPERCAVLLEMLGRRVRTTVSVEALTEA